MTSQVLQITFWQKILGKNYKWFYIVQYYFNLHNSGLFALFVAQGSLMIGALITAFVWTFADGGSSIFTYLLLGRIYKGMTESYNYDEISRRIFEGKIVRSLLLPTNFLTGEFFKTLGERLIHNTINTSTFILAALIAFNTFAQFQGATLTNLGWLILFILPSFLIWFLAGEIVGLTAFFFKDPRNYARSLQSYNTLLGVMASNYIPLDKLPFPQFWLNTPFAFAVHHPMQIYLGKYNQEETLLVLGGAIFWCIFLYFLAKMVFRTGLKRNESVGL